MKKILALLVIALAVVAVVRLQTPAVETIELPADEIVEDIAEVPVAVPVVRINENLSIHSTNAILISPENGGVLFDRNSTQRMYPASMVKMMTALVAIENIGDLNERVFLRPEIFNYADALGATRAGFLAGDSIRAMDLLFGLMLPSGAECAIGLAEFVSGSERAFVTLMNEKAREIGMNDTNFTNTTGLHNPNQFSTVADIALLLEYALDNEMFYRLITTYRHSTAPSNFQEGGITFHSTLFSRMANREFAGGEILGGRTGFTNEAGQCLASFAEINGQRYILVTSGANPNGNHLTHALHVEDAFTVFEEISRL